VAKEFGSRSKNKGKETRAKSAKLQQKDFFFLDFYLEV
jgi:hypothetical protein